MTALKLTKRAKIAGLASMALAATSLTVVFASHSALASTSPKGGSQPTTTVTPGGPSGPPSYSPTASPTCTCMHTPTAPPTTVSPPPTSPAPTPPAPAPTAVPTALPVTG